MTVTYRPRSSLKALARQFFRTGQWRREVIAHYPQTASVRYLAPPIAVFGLVGGILAGLLGLLTRTRWPLVGFAAPLGYLSVITAGSLRLEAPPAARVRLPAVIMIMHVSWGLGFLVGVRKKQES